MKSKTVLDNRFLNSGPFVMLSPSAKLLYIYLLSYADDDGIVDAIMPMRACGAVPNDLETLISKQFVFGLQDTLVFIIDYALHNQNIDARYKKDSNYLPLLAKKLPNAMIISIQTTKKGGKKKVFLTADQYVKNIDSTAINANPTVSPASSTRNPACAPGISPREPSITKLNSTEDNSTEDNSTEDNLTEDNSTQLSSVKPSTVNRIRKMLEDAGIAKKSITMLLSQDLPNIDTIQAYIVESKNKKKPASWLFCALRDRYELDQGVDKNGTSLKCPKPHSPEGKAGESLHALEEYASDW